MLRYCKCWLFLLLAVLAVNCIDKKGEGPKVEMLSPSPCDTLWFGENFRFTIQLSANDGLGNVSMDLHHNFNHHNHGDNESCHMDPSRDPTDPFYDSWIFLLPANKTTYILDTLIVLPSTKDAEKELVYEEGDYHFHIYVTDNDGYQVFTTFDVKVLNR